MLESRILYHPGSESGIGLPHDAATSLAWLVSEGASHLNSVEAVKEITNQILSADEVLQRGTLRRLSRQARINLLTGLCTYGKSMGSPGVELVEKLLDTSRNLVDLNEVVQRVGVETLRNSPFALRLTERVALGQVGCELQGE